jgi:hypothetical protein
MPGFAFSQVSVSHDSGIYNLPFDLEIASQNTGTRILYTLDGSEPLLDNLDGVTYSYKVRYPLFSGQPLGDTLFNTFQTFEYDGPIPIINRDRQSERLAMIATSHNDPPFYFPESPLPKGTVVKFREVFPNGIHGMIYTHTYFVSDAELFATNYPIISISIQEDLLFDYYKGIYVPGVVMDSFRLANPSATLGGFTPGNFSRRGNEWEYPAFIEVFENSNFLNQTNSTDKTSKFRAQGTSERNIHQTDATRERVLAQGIGLRIHGGFSRSYPVKSLRLYARNIYGSSHFNYDLFGGSETYKRLVLRNSGNDYNYTYFRDALIHTLFADLNFDSQKHRPALLFINGEFWGIHHIRERHDKHFLGRVHGVDPENIDLLERNAEVKEGTSDAYNYLMNFVTSNNLSDEEHYAYVQTLMDIDNYIDYQLAQIFTGNTDWPSNNIDYWRFRCNPCNTDTKSAQDGRFRWLFYDADFGFGLFGTQPNHNTLFHALQSNNASPNATNPPWSTELFRQLSNNTSFQNKLVSRYLDLSNTVFDSSNIHALIDQLEASLQPAMPWHIARWSMPENMQKWQEHVDYVRYYVDERPQHVRSQFRIRYGFSSLQYTVEVRTGPENGGFVQINSIQIADVDEIWSGSYPNGHTLKVTAIPANGFRFSHWAGHPDSTASSVNLNVNKNLEIEPVFIESDENLLLYYWHFNDLQTVGGQISPDYMYQNGGLSGGKAFLTYTGSGSGYMDLIDGSPINSFNNSPAGNALRVRNPSNQRVLEFQLPTSGLEYKSISFATRRTPNGATQQQISISFDAGQTWDLVGNPYVINENFTVVSAELPERPVEADNTATLLKIEFLGAEAANSSGNNRFDNIAIFGDKVPVSNPAELSLPRQTSLAQNYPNPFNPSTTIRFHLSDGGFVQLEVYDIIGRLVSTLIRQELPSGYHSIDFGAGNLPSGIYFYRLKSTDFEATRAMTLIK